MLLIGCVISLSGIKSNRYFKEHENDKSEKTIISEVAFDEEKEMCIWYTNPDLEEYFNYLKRASKEEKGIDVAFVYKDKDTLVDDVNQANISREDVPDLYIMPSENIGKAYLAGITKELDFEEITKEKAEDNNLYAGRFSDVLCGIPYYFEEPVLLYNKDYVEKVPETFDDILAYADEFDGEKYPDVSSILKWDIKELQYNYGFVGNYLSFGGDDGDDASIIDVKNSDVYNGLNYYASLKDYFSADLSTVDYDKTLEDFSQGKVVFTIVNSQDLSRILDFKDKVITEDNMGITKIPDMKTNLISKTLSFTDVICVNPYGNKYCTDDNNITFDVNQGDEEIYDFINYMYGEKTEDLYEKTNYIPCYKWEDEVFYNQYLSSTGLPKIPESNGFYVSLEVAMEKVWNKALPKDAMEELENTLK